MCKLRRYQMQTHTEIRKKDPSTKILYTFVLSCY